MISPKRFDLFFPPDWGMLRRSDFSQNTVLYCLSSNKLRITIVIIGQFSSITSSSIYYLKVPFIDTHPTLDAM